MDIFLRNTMAGRGQVIFVTGEAGQGKTLLLQAFAERARAQWPQLIIVKGNCNAYTGIGDPYLPFREMMEALIRTAVTTAHHAGSILSFVIQTLVSVWTRPGQHFHPRNCFTRMHSRFECTTTHWWIDCEPSSSKKPATVGRQ